MKLVVCCTLFSAICLMFACRDNPSSTPSQGSPLPPIGNAVYVLNEGNYSDATGARLSIYDIDRDAVYKDVFELANNGSHLGSTGDDIKLYRGRAYILMSHSENLVMIDLDTHQQVQSATFLGSIPREMLIDSIRNKLYVSRTNSGAVFVLDPSTLSIIRTITVGSNPLGMTIAGNNLFVCNSGYGADRTVSVIDARADTLKATLVLSDGPTSAAVAPDGKVWVACSGNAFGTPPTNGKIFIINPINFVKEDSISFSESIWGDIAIGTNGYAYTTGIAGFYGGPLHRISLSSKTVQMGFIADTSYTMAVDQVSGDIYVADARNFNENGVVSVYSNTGVLRKRFGVQRGPGAMAFKH
jgi:YVTN family beta-propeller protein